MSTKRLQFVIKLSDILQRLKDFSGLKKDIEIAEIIGLKKNTLTVAKSRNSIPYESLVEYCNNNGLNIHWLLTGQGTMFMEEVSASGMTETEILTDKTIGMIKNLTTDDLRFVYGVIEEKIRVRELESRIDEMTKK